MPRPYYSPRPRYLCSYSARRQAQRRAQGAARLALLGLAVALPLLACALAYVALAPVAAAIGQGLAVALP